jgi:hypothetical protein
MAGTTGLEPATSAVTECKYYYNHRVTDDFTANMVPISPLESIGAMELYLCLYLRVRRRQFAPSVHILVSWHLPLPTELKPRPLGSLRA